MNILKRLENRDNNFDFLRFFAAALVILSHSFPLTGKGFEPYLWLTGYAAFGDLAVNIFFVLSGFLITRSWISDSNFFSYAQKRVLRIFPGLVFAVFVTVFVFGPLLTSFGLKEYFSSSITLNYLRNIFLFPIHYILPGVFQGNIYPNAVNGSLWTLSVEFPLYFAIAAIGLFGFFRKRILVLLIAAVLFVVKWYFLENNDFKSDVFFFVQTYEWLRCSLYFFIGALFYLYREKIKLNKQTAILFFAIFLLSFRNYYGALISFLTLPYLILYVGFLKIGFLKNFSRYGDFSYGLYIYAFPVQQTIVHLSGNRISPFVLFPLAFVSTLVLAVASWKLVEEPFLRLKSFPFQQMFFDKVLYIYKKIKEGFIAQES